MQFFFYYKVLAVRLILNWGDLNAFMITYYSVNDLFYIKIWRHYFSPVFVKILCKTLTLKSMEIHTDFSLPKYYGPFSVFIFLKSLTAKYVWAIGLFIYYKNKTSIFGYQGTYLRGGQAYICFSLLLMFCWRANVNVATFIFFTPLAESSCREILHMGFFDGSFHFYLLLWLWQSDWQ